MKLRNITIVSIILLAILTFSAVNAADNLTTDDLGVVNDNNDLNVSLPNEEIGSGNDIGENNLETSNDEVIGDTEKIVTPDNISQYSTSVEAGNYKFIGQFNRPFSYLTFDSGCRIDASQAEFINMGIVLKGNVVINGLTIDASHYNEFYNDALIYINGDDNIVENLNVKYAPDDDADVYAILLDGANNFRLLNSIINFTGTSLSDTYEYAIKIISCQYGVIKGNTIIANLPILPVDYNKGEPGLDTDLVLNTGIKESSFINITDNSFIANVVGREGGYPTLDCVMIEYCNNINIFNNTFSESDFITPQGDANYLNVLDMYYSNNVSVKNNNINVETTGGSENAGTAYPVQITGPYEDVVIDGNTIYASSFGPVLGIYSQNYYGDTEILVQNNNIEVHGLPTFHSWGLVSGIELQDTIARVYNNTIFTASITGTYEDGANLYGISYAQALMDGHYYDIQANTIETEGKYAIYMLKIDNITISGNYLVSSTGEADQTIYIAEATGNVNISNNQGRKKDDDNVVTKDNFNSFFREDGYLRENVTFDELIFKGTFNGICGHLYIKRSLTIRGDNAVLNNMGVKITSDNVKLIDLTFTANEPLESLIYVEANDVDLINLNVSYSTDTDEAVAIDLYQSSNVNLLNSTIFFESHVIDDSLLSIGVQAVETQNVLMDSNNITTKLPCVCVNNYDTDYYLMGSNNVNPVRFKDCNQLTFTNNIINSTTNNFTAEFPTIQSIYIIGCSDSLIDHNAIYMIDEMTPEGMDNYMYGIDFGFNTNVTFSYNNFTMFTSGGKEAAGTNYAFQGVESEVIIKGNRIVSKSNGPNLGIYVTSMFGADSQLLIEDNFINVTGYASSSGNWALVSGIEIQNGDAKIYNNTIYTYNVNTYDENAYIYGISYAQWMYGDRSFEIANNTVYSEGKYAISVINADYLYVTNNGLFAHELNGDDSVDPGSCSDVQLNGNYPSAVKSDANITIKLPSNAKVGETVTIEVTADTTADLKVTINGEYIGVLRGKFNYTVKKGGLNTINVFASQNAFFYQGNETRVFSADKGDADIIIPLPQIIKIGDTVVINPQTSSDGALTIKVNNAEINGTFTVLSNGTYLVEVWSSETANYNAGYNYTSFTAVKDASSVNISVVPARAGEKSVIYVNVTDGATGSVVVNVGGVEYPISVLDKKLELVLTKGTYSVFASYGGDNRFNSSVSEVKTLIVEEKLDANIKIEIPQNITVGQTIIINVTADTTSDLAVSIDGVDVNIAGGKITYTVSKSGLHTVNVVSQENSIYKACNVSKTFNANRIDTVITLPSFSNVKVGDTIVINPQTNSDGKITIKVNGVEINGTYTIPSNGTYTIDVTTPQTDSYTAGHNSTSFKVVKDASSVNISVVPARVGEKSVIYVNVTDGATGSVVVNVDGVEYPISVLDKKLELVLTKGSYSVFATYTGDNRFNSSVSEVKTLIVEEKLDANIKIELPQNIQANESIIINVTADTTSDLAVSIDGVDVNIIGGKITYKVLKGGIHTINVVSQENSLYKKGNVSETFNASRLDAVIILPAFDNVKVGNTIVINPQTASDGVLTIKVNDTEINGTYTFLLSGTYVVVVESAQSDIYNAGINTTTINVVKEVSDVNATVIPAKALDESKIIINVTKGATGEVVVKLNNTQVYKGLVNETNIVSLGNLQAGKYTVNVTYLGDDYFNGSSDVGEFTVSKSQSHVFADSLQIIEGEIATLTVNVNAGASGKVLVVVNGKEYYADISNNTATLNISNLTANQYIVNITYLGDEKYDVSSNTTIITVKKQMSVDDISIIVDVPQKSTSAKITIKLPADATGNLTVVVDQIQYKKELTNASVVLNLNDLYIGKHNVDVTYLGDSKYIGISKSASFEVKNPEVVVKKTATKFTAAKKSFKAKTKTKKYTVTLKAGKNPVKYVKVTLKVKGKTYKAKTNAKGKATFKITKLTKKGKHNAVIKFAGNNNYKQTSKTIKIIIK